MAKFDFIKIIKHAIDESEFGKKAQTAWNTFDEYDKDLWRLVGKIGDKVEKELTNLEEE